MDPTSDEISSIFDQSEEDLNLLNERPIKLCESIDLQEWVKFSSILNISHDEKNS